MSREYFTEDYFASRARFRGGLGWVRARWPEARLESFAVHPGEDLTIDWISAEPSGEPQRGLLITIGEHGIEGYVGSAVLECFLAEFLERLDPSHTGLTLVHAINPWGMQHWRRVNANNVDLNRNFTWLDNPASDANIKPYDQTFNPIYRQLNPLLNPIGSAGRWTSGPAFAAGLLGMVIFNGVGQLRNSILMGQYHTPQGIYYGGNEQQAETQQMMALFCREIARYRQVVHLDMHTGYGPRYQMSLVNSALEAGESDEFAGRFNYPRVVKANPAEFYPIQGDMVDAVYRLAQAEFPGKRVYATAFEFGTLGDSFAAALRSLWATVNENRLHRFGAASMAAEAQIRTAFRELFYPTECRWREKALEDTRRAFNGILKAEGFLA